MADAQVPQETSGNGYLTEQVMSKGTWVLVGVLAALAVAVYVVMQRTGEMNASATPDKMLVSIDSAAASRIEVTSPTMHVLLERGPSGWMMVQPAGGPADAERVAQFLSSAGKIELVSTASTNPQKHGLFNVDSNGVRFLVATERKDTVSFIIGKAQPGATSMRDVQFFARKAGADNVWLTRTYLGYAFSYSPDLWRDRKILAVPRETIDRIDYTYGDTTFAVVRQDSSWLIGTARANSGLMTSITGTLANLQASGFADTVLGPLPKPAAIMSVLGKTLTFYPFKNESKIVTVSDKPNRFVVPDWTTADLLKRKKELLP
jgi:hypothetical protein